MDDKHAAYKRDNNRPVRRKDTKRKRDPLLPQDPRSADEDQDEATADVAASSPSPSSPSSSSSSSSFPGSLRLLTARHDDKIVAVRILVNGTPCSPPPGFVASQESFIGHDGNKFYCQVCKELGEIVCCDGCPRAFHPGCLPAHGDSHRSLLRDDDPWFCPVCWDEGRGGAHRGNGSKKPTNRPRTGGNSQRGPSSVGEFDGESLSEARDGGNRFMQSEDEDSHVNSDKLQQPLNRGLKRQAREIPKPIFVPDDDRATKLKQKLFQSRKRPHSKITNQEPQVRRNKLTDQEGAQSEKASTIDTPSRSSSQLAQLEPADPLVAALGNRSPAKGIVQATPAFYYFLSESRWKIERALSKSHRYFNRLSKGNFERNALVAKEAAVWWTKLRPSEHRRYIKMSMRDYENRIIEWKEDRNLERIWNDDGDLENEWTDEAQPMEDTEEDKQWLRDLHERVYRNTAVACKSFSKDPGVLYNHVLLTALHDMRFHPPPSLFDVNRLINTDTTTEPGVSIQVCGPVATSAGDECLGCARGWVHNCPVVKRRLPAVPRRAALQPGLSSLVTTRVGLGIRHRLDRLTDSDESPPEKHDENLFEWKRSTKQKELDKLQMLTSFTMKRPGQRADDVTRFIELGLAITVPEPNDIRSDHAGTMKRGRIYSCGHCRKLVHSERGCVSCRRAELVSHFTKSQASDRIGNLTVQSIMMNRTKNGEKAMNPGVAEDKTVVDTMLRSNWLPMAVLSNQTMFILKASNNENGKESEKEFENGNEESDDSFESEDQEFQEGDHALASENLHARISDNSQVFVKNSQVLDRTTQASEGSLDSHDVGETGLGDKENKGDSDKEEEDESEGNGAEGDLLRRAVFIACSGMFLAIMRRDPFHLLRKSAVYEENSQDKELLTGLGAVVSKLLTGFYKDIQSFVDEMLVLCEALQKNNDAESQMSKTALVISNLVENMNGYSQKWFQGVIDVDTHKCERDELRFSHRWPKLSQVSDYERWLRQTLASDFMRTEENEVVYYGALAVRRAATAAHASLAPDTLSSGPFGIISMRSDRDDQALRDHIDQKVSAIEDRVQLQDVPNSLEEQVIQTLAAVKKRRIDVKAAHICSRCIEITDQVELANLLRTDNSFASSIFTTKKDTSLYVPRIDKSRLSLSTGLGSNETIRILSSVEGEAQQITRPKCFISVKNSSIHGFGVFADKSFAKGDVVDDYQGGFRIADLAGGQGDIKDNASSEDRCESRMIRFLNHSCEPNCSLRVVSDGESNRKKAMLIAESTIEINEELTYDYRMPVERILDKRIPCRCASNACRGFLNWPCPECIGLKSVWARGKDSDDTTKEKKGRHNKSRV